MKRRSPAAKIAWYLVLLSPLVLTSLLLIIWSPNGLLHLRQLQVEYQDLSARNLMLEKQNHQIYQEISLLLNNPIAIERLARQELGLIKEDELVLQFLPPAASSEVPAN